MSALGIFFLHSEELGFYPPQNNILFLHYSLVDYLKKHFSKQPSSWNIPKIHAMIHYREDIIRGGATQEYSAEMWENSHKTVMKAPYRKSNKKNIESQIMNHHSMTWSITMLKTKMSNARTGEVVVNAKSEVIQRLEHNLFIN